MKKYCEIHKNEIMQCKGNSEKAQIFTYFFNMLCDETNVEARKEKFAEITGLAEGTYENIMYKNMRHNKETLEVIAEKFSLDDIEEKILNFYLG